MTCRHAQSLLDAWLDSELSPEQANFLTAHLEGCEVCREEFDSGSQLREIMDRGTFDEPRVGYWDEVTSIILARTVDNDPETSKNRDVATSGSRGKSVLLRPLVSVIVSLGFLAAALFVGANKEIFTPVSDSPIVYEHTLTAGSWPVSGDVLYSVSPEDEALLTRAMLLLTPPGPLSRMDAAKSLAESN